MSTTSQAIIEPAKQLITQENIEVVNALLASMDKPSAEIDKQWAAEAEQ